MLAFLHLSLRKFDEAFDFSERAMALGPNNSFAAGVAVSKCLGPRQKLFLGNPITLTGIFQTDQPPAHGGYQFSLASRDPSLCTGWRKIFESERFA